MAGQITANDLKIKGIGAIDEIAAGNEEVVISVRGKRKYVVLPLDRYNQLREYELDAAIRESERDIAEGKFFSGSIEDHLKRVGNV
jgi:prevent-host-death family protein